MKIPPKEVFPKCKGKGGGSKGQMSLPTSLYRYCKQTQINVSYLSFPSPATTIRWLSGDHAIS